MYIGGLITVWPLAGNPSARQPPDISLLLVFATSIISHNGNLPVITFTRLTTDRSYLASECDCEI